MSSQPGAGLAAPGLSESTLMAVPLEFSKPAEGRDPIKIPLASPLKLHGLCASSGSLGARSGSRQVLGNNPFERQLAGANLRLKRAQLALLKKPQGVSERKALAVAQQAFSKAWQLSLSHQGFKPPPTIPEHSVAPLQGRMNNVSNMAKGLTGWETKSMHAGMLQSNLAKQGKRQRNRVSATKYRLRKKAYVQELEARVASLENEVGTIRAAMARLQSENTILRSNLAFLRKLLESTGPQPEVATAAMVTSTPTACMLQTDGFFSTSNTVVNNNPLSPSTCAKLQQTFAVGEAPRTPTYADDDNSSDKDQWFIGKPENVKEESTRRG
uniref:BZIP domain-containing protein n=1 Tax=Lotharella globosa TaxID=91324 RepID=A0A6U3DJS7_9EUKA|mmetsp:Transcript_19923/g.40271  ORF Transcript_19923/g.40271 Transcript_19923/m.40271 type:complete len:327 (+) Transcript_19923:74-1054(+)